MCSFFVIAINQKATREWMVIRWGLFPFGSSLGFHLEHMLCLGVISWSAGDLVNLCCFATLLSSLFTACFRSPSVHLAHYDFTRLQCLVASV